MFRGAILESGASIPPGPADYTAFEVGYNPVLSQANCGQASDGSQCLRDASIETSNDIFNNSIASSLFSNIDIDDDIVQ